MKYEVTERAEILLKEEVKIVRISVRDLVEFVYFLLSEYVGQIN